MLRPKPTHAHPLADYADCPAKTLMGKEGITVVGRTVVDHCHIVGHVARALIKRFPASLIDPLFPTGTPLAAAAHDIGKVSPYFVEKLRRHCAGSITGISANLSIDPYAETQWGGHAGVSQLTAMAVGAPPYVAQILGHHHGFSPNVSTYDASHACFGGPPWQHERVKLVNMLKNSFKSDWPVIQNYAQARVVGGLTTVADWIGSGRHFEDPSDRWDDRIEMALDDAGMTFPAFQKSLSFSDVFGFNPRDAQSLLIDAVTGPGVYVFEGQMGLGKTEAALFAAYKMLDEGKARGIYFALPTQLTSNKIYDRFNAFLSCVLDNDSAHRSLLLHGSAHLLEQAEMGEDAKPGGDWFNQSKRGLLAPFAVGTLDQALMAVMNVKHGAVRAFGLAGKVVILDEVHTYDAYTGTIMDALVSLFRSMECTVIILSATLNHDKREQLLGCTLSSSDYPLITAMPKNEQASENTVESATTHTVRVRMTPDEPQALQEALLRASEGQQVLWIENTVKQAQDRYLDLAAIAADLGIETGLIHSRFTQHHRSVHEERWVGLFGKPGWDKRAEKGRILIGTQVLEQSIDIDADFLVTRFCPTDMLLQRIGRLWRHSDAPRHPNAQCEVMIIGPNYTQAVSDPEAALGPSAFVYSPYVLCRALQVWESLSQVSLPGDIRSLIESSYEKRVEQGDMKSWLDQLDHGTRHQVGRNALHQLARLTLSSNGSTYGEDKAQTRYSEDDAADVLILKRIEQASASTPAILTLLDGSRITLPKHQSELSKSDLRSLSSKLMQQVVKSRIHEAPKAVNQSVLKSLGLHHCFYLGDPNQESALLRVVTVGESGTLRSLSGAAVNDSKSIIYRPDVGYLVTKNKVKIP